MRALWLQAAVALASVGLAYSTFVTEDEGGGQSTGETVFMCTPDQLQRLSVETPHYAHVAEPDPGDKGSGFVFVSTRSPSSDSSAGTATSPTSERREERFIANGAFGVYLERLLPLRADRRLGTLTKDREREFGLTEPAAQMAVVCGDRTLRLEVGGRSYGRGSRYVRRVHDKQVFVIPGDLVQDLQSARYKFKKTSPLSFGLSDVVAVTVDAGGQSSRFKRPHVGSESANAWVLDGGSGQRAPALAAWLSQVHGLRIQRYLAPDGIPGAELSSSDVVSAPPAATTVLSVRYEGRDGAELDRLTVVRVLHAARAHYYARARDTRGWVAMVNSATDRVVQDVALVLGPSGQGSAVGQRVAPAADRPLPGMPAAHPPLPNR